MMIVWDFDRTIMDDDSDRWVVVAMGSVELFDWNLMTLNDFDVFRTKNHICNRDHTRVLTTQCRNRNCVRLPIVSLVMYEVNWENKNITLIQYFGNMTVVRVRRDKPNLQTTFQHNQDFRSTRVRVRWVDPPWRVINTSQRDSKSVESSQLSHGNRGHPGPHRI
ncbi:hypothetical protein OSB04_015288 [Centaurea solstitialis]|uniref:Uncharacterized protein n=1 Tax=Centaurea solstitialis TaxID=347529 RepID=A0AA38TIP6_9ASTR|nr:hypothetical protein OSB04_015288 [Centaurea solstitialis]